MRQKSSEKPQQGSEVQVTDEMITAGVAFCRDSGWLAFEGERPMRAWVAELLGAALGGGSSADVQTANYLKKMGWWTS